MERDPLRATVAARRLGMSTSDLLRLIHDRQIRYVMVDDIAHTPDDAIAEHQRRPRRSGLTARHLNDALKRPGER